VLKKFTLTLLVFSASSFGSITIPLKGECVSSFENQTLGSCRYTFDGSLIDPNRDVLFLSEVSDADITFVNSIEVGRTGYVFEQPFYLGFLPRIYSFPKVSSAPFYEVEVQAKSLSWTKPGLPEGSLVVVTDLGTAIQKYLYIVLPRIIGVFLLGLVFSFLFERSSTSVDEWVYSRKFECLTYVGAGLFILSMLKIPRVLIPFFLSAFSYYKLHILVEGLAVWALGAYLASSRFKINGLSYKEFYLPKDSYAIGVLLIFSHFALGANFLVFSLPEITNIRDFHAKLIFVQAFVLLALVFFSFVRMYKENIFERLILYNKMLFLFTAFISIVLIRDATVYAFLTNSNRSYYVQHFFGALLFMFFLRQRSILRMSTRSKATADEMRMSLSNISDGMEQVRFLCDQLAKKWNFARVSLVSVIEDQGLLMASSGPEAFKVDNKPRELGALLKRVVDSKLQVYEVKGSSLSRGGLNGDYNCSCLFLPIIEKETVKAVLCIKAFSKVEIPPKVALELRLSTHQLTLEIGFAMTEGVLQQRVEQLKSLAISTSGIVFEATDAWGRISENFAEKERVIVTSDGLKTTFLSENCLVSPVLWSLYTSYKRDLYSIWFALRQQFEFISKDVRGDDFWSLSPREFRNPFLQKLGQEKVGVILGILLDRYCRMLTFSENYRVLGLSGAHVAVGKALLPIIILGTKDSRCVDIDSPYMSRIQRIRSEAFPGRVLIDCSSAELREALNDSELFPIMKKYLANKSMFADLKNLPDLVEIGDFSSVAGIDELEENARKIAGIQIIRKVAA